jgi:hypothetical protein
MLIPGWAYSILQDCLIYSIVSRIARGLSSPRFDCHWIWKPINGLHESGDLFGNFSAKPETFLIC